MNDESEDEDFICPLTNELCIRAFCEAYGCADHAAVPFSEYDVEFDLFPIPEWG